MRYLALFMLLNACAPVHMEGSFSLGENQVIDKKTSIRHSDVAVSDNFVEIGDTINELLQFFNTIRLQRTQDVPAKVSGNKPECDETGLRY